MIHGDSRHARPRPPSVYASIDESEADDDAAQLLGHEVTVVPRAHITITARVIANRAASHPSASSPLHIRRRPNATLTRSSIVGFIARPLSHIQ